MATRNPHNLQQIEWRPDGTVRFRQNAIVRFLREQRPFGMNQLAQIPFSDDDREQFAQLIGYSVAGFGDLPYANPEVVALADSLADELHSGDSSKPAVVLRADNLVGQLQSLLPKLTAVQRLDSLCDLASAFGTTQSPPAEIAKGLELAAQHMERRAQEFDAQDSITSQTFSRIYRDEAAAIRKLEDV